MSTPVQDSTHFELPIGRLAGFLSMGDAVSASNRNARCQKLSLAIVPRKNSEVAWIVEFFNIEDPRL